jgi:hypothetical protein
MRRRRSQLTLLGQPASGDWPADFAEQFWRLYPRRVAKKAALAALARVRRSGEVAFPDLLAAVERYADSVVGKDLHLAQPGPVDGRPCASWKHVLWTTQTILR